MGFKQLITRCGTAPYDEKLFTFDVIEGGALKISKSGGPADLIAPGFWVAVIDSDSSDRLDWEFLVPDRARD